MSIAKLSKIVCLDGFLVSISPEIVDYDKVNEEQAISEVVKRNNALSILQTLQEGQEVLAMEPFPWEWVQDVSQTLVYDDEKEQWVEDPVIYKKWLTKILIILQEEAIKAGKLDKPVLKLK